MRRVVAAIKPGEKAALDVVRDGKRMKLTAIVTSRPDEQAEVQAEGAAGGEENVPVKPELALLNGLGLEELNRSYRSQLRIPADVEGVLITEVDPSSPAADQGIRQGDVITAVNRQGTRNLREFNARIKSIKDNKIMLTIWREGGRDYVVLKE
jgi:serine protease Do